MISLHWLQLLYNLKTSHFIHVCQASAGSFPSGTLHSSPLALFMCKIDHYSPEHLLPWQRYWLYCF